MKTSSLHEREVLFSIIIPLFNKRNYVSRCIESILNQKYPYYELIIVDANSTDGSYELATEYSNRSSKLRLYQKPNYGYGVAKNFGVNVSNGSFIAFLDADDEWNDDFLLNIHKLIQDYRQADAFLTGHRRVLSSDKSLEVVYSEEGDCGYLNRFVRARKRGWGAHTSSTVFRAKSFRESGGFPSTVFSRSAQKTWLINQESSVLREFNWLDEAPASAEMTDMSIIPYELRCVPDLRVELPGTPSEDQYIFDYFFIHHKYSFTVTLSSTYYKNIPNQTIERIRRKEYGRFFPHLIQILNTINRYEPPKKSDEYTGYIDYYKYLSVGVFSNVLSYPQVERERFLKEYQIIEYWGGGSRGRALINLFLWRLRRKILYLFSLKD